MTRRFSVMLTVLLLLASTLTASVDQTLNASQWSGISNATKFQSNPQAYKTTNPFYNLGDGSLAIDFPMWQDSLNYLYRNYTGKAAPTMMTVSVSIVTNGNAVFDYGLGPDNPCVNPANLRPFFWSNHFSWADGDRWFSNPSSYYLADGSIIFQIPLTPDKWSGVYGEWATDAPAWWQSAINNISAFGIVIGGGCFFGHGVGLDQGTATVIIHSISLQ